MNLVIVESPAKGRTLQRFLGSDYKVSASFGHVRDLPEKELGVDVEHDFSPKYTIIARARKNLARLKEAVDKADAVYLATDYDREGEAIGWHLAQALAIKKPKRITFHEITKDAILDALKEPREIDEKLVDAQQARRVLDRLVGYKLSPFLWRKVFKGLSAGRVQSVAVRLIVDREREIEQFKPQEYWSIIGNFDCDSASFNAELIEFEGRKLEKLDIKSKNDADKIVEALSGFEFRISDLRLEETLKWALPPFTTSTLQQDANRRLGFSSKKTMKLAQDLYEAGQITYMRTDSTNLAWVAVNTTRKLIEAEFGKDYLPEKPRQFKTRTPGAQEAHEAIRPTYIETKTPKGTWTRDHTELYQLIWNRMVACQMTPAKLSVSTVDIKAGDKGVFRAIGQVLVFDGWMKVYPIKIEEKSLPKLANSQVVKLNKLEPLQHFTKPPDRYSEATLIKALEQHGIGRPSTYVPIISTIQDRGYVRLQSRFFYPEQIGLIVTDILTEHFPQIVNIDFTANMEARLDEIAEGQHKWQDVIADFYGPFAKNLAEKEKTVAKTDVEHNISEGAGEPCPKCGRPMVVKSGRFGRFLACSGYPDCKTTKQLVGRTGITCPECNKGELVSRRTKKGRQFWGCERFPDCKYATWRWPGSKAALASPITNKRE